MLMVIKRSGEEVPFNIQRIHSTLAAASDEINQSMGSADIRLLGQEVEEKFEGKEKITSREIYEALVATLQAHGMDNLVTAYRSNRRNHWN